MAWYDKLIKQGIVVRGTVEESNNNFYYQEVPIHELNDDGSFKIVINKKTNEKRFVYKKDSKGNMLFNKKPDKESRIDDAYIECGGKMKNSQVFCITASVPNLRKHTYLCCGYSYGSTLNRLREYYIEYLGDESDIKKLNKQSGKLEWQNEIMINAILAEGKMFDFEFYDGEIYFKTKEIDILDEIMKIKRVKGTASDPFSFEYLNFDKYKIPEEDLEKFNEAKINKFGKLEFGDSRTLAVGKIIKEYTIQFMNSHEINNDTKRKYRIKDNKDTIHKLGLFDEFIKGIYNLRDV